LIKHTRILPFAHDTTPIPADVPLTLFNL